MRITTYQVRLPANACSAAARVNTISTMLSSQGNIACSLINPTLTLPLTMSPQPVYNGNCTLPVSGIFNFNGASSNIPGADAEYRHLTYETYTRANYLGLSYRRPVGFRSETGKFITFSMQNAHLYTSFDCC